MHINTSTPIVMYTTNAAIFSGMDTDSLSRNLKAYTKTLAQDTLTPEERTGFEYGRNLCQQEFNNRFGIKTQA